MYLFAALKPKDWKHDSTFDRMSNENYCMMVFDNNNNNSDNGDDEEDHFHSTYQRQTAKWKWQQQPNKLLCIIYCDGAPTANTVIITMAASTWNKNIKPWSKTAAIYAFYLLSLSLSAFSVLILWLSWFHYKKKYSKRFENDSKYETL